MANEILGNNITTEYLDSFAIDDLFEGRRFAERLRRERTLQSFPGVEYPAEEYNLREQIARANGQQWITRATRFGWFEVL